MTVTATRICPLCEATCGLTVELDGPRVLSVRPNRDDVFSEGHACAKGLGLGAVEADTDRVRTPLVRRDGVLREASWDEAFARIAEHLPPLVAEDPNSVAVYTGNPAAHQLDYTLYLPALLGALGSRNLFSPASLDTLPKNLVCSLLYGTPLGMPVPDLDRTDLLILIGTNPLVSNGSTICAPGMDKRLAALRRRGGHLVVIDPARTRTAEVADRHLAVRPGRDAHLLLGMLCVIATEDLAAPANPHLDGVAEVLGLAREFTPEHVAPACGVPAAEIRDLARRFATARRAVVHSRIGTCAQEFGSLANWLVEVLNAVTGRLDAVGGALFATPPGGGQTTWPGSMRRLPFGRWHSRVRGLPEAMGELPAACLAEEILTPGEGQVRALVTLAGNPARSLPGSANLERALGELDFLLCLDSYLNETTRHADVVLPPPNLFSHGHIDLTLNHYQLRNVARWSPAVVEPGPGEMPDWHQLLRLTAILRGSPDTPVEELDEEIAAQAARRAAKLVGVDTETALRAVGERRGPERLVDLRLRSGPYGDRFTGDGLTLAALEAAPNGIDYGPLGPRLPDVLRTPDGRIDLAPALLVEDLDRLRGSLDPAAEDELLLVNRRQRRGMNSWLHNALPHRDDAESALHMHPTDAARRGLVHGDAVVVESATGRVTAALHLADSVREGVVSLPHGWGHTGDGVRLTHAAAAPGVNVNTLVDDRHVEPITGIPIFNGVAVTVGAAR